MREAARFFNLVSPSRKRNELDGPYDFYWTHKIHIGSPVFTGALIAIILSGSKRVKCVWCLEQFMAVCVGRSS
jgi:hypothetical protein